MLLISLFTISIHELNFLNLGIVITTQNQSVLAVYLVNVTNQFLYFNLLILSTVVHFILAETQEIIMSVRVIF